METEIKYVYGVTKFYGSYAVDARNIPPTSLAGIFDSMERARQAVISSGPHDIWEYAYSTVCIEKLHFNSLGCPACVFGLDQEPVLWFRWECDEPFEELQTGRYVLCEEPKWAEHVFAWTPSGVSEIPLPEK